MVIFKILTDSNYRMLVLQVNLHILVGFAVHEFSHAYTAYRLGDDSEIIKKRLSWNPFVQISPIASIIFAVITAITWEIPIFFFAKPVMLNRDRLSSIKIIKVALAGPLSNLILCLPFAFFDVKFEHYSSLSLFFHMGFSINMLLFIVNMFPMPPLDGSWIYRAFIPVKRLTFTLYVLHTIILAISVLIVLNLYEIITLPFLHTFLSAYINIARYFISFNVYTFLFQYLT